MFATHKGEFTPNYSNLEKSSKLCGSCIVLALRAGTYSILGMAWNFCRNWYLHVFLSIFISQQYKNINRYRINFPDWQQLHVGARKRRRSCTRNFDWSSAMSFWKWKNSELRLVSLRRPYMYIYTDSTLAIKNDSTSIVIDEQMLTLILRPAQTPVLWTTPTLIPTLILTLISHSNPDSNAHAHIDTDARISVFVKISRGWNAKTAQSLGQRSPTHPTDTHVHTHTHVHTYTHIHTSSSPLSTICIGEKIKTPPCPS